ncbi:MAG: ATP synthase F1 subunit epsilon [Bacteroidetes bacterium]|nr:MAG: ATP synthase F1 subunit epsilon [Bacteroidota bacterium]
MKTFDLEIVTPEKQVFAGAVQSVQVPGTQGSFQVLHQHAPIISTLSKGKIKLVNAAGEEHTYSMQDGVIEVLNNKAIVLVERILDED